MLPALAFYLFSGLLLLSGLLVITARNPVHSVLFLILAFFNAAGLFVLLGAEFVAMILVIVYVGAVAVLFLFVVMMLDINFASLRRGSMQYAPLGLLIGAILLSELFVLYKAWPVPNAALEVVASETVVEEVVETVAVVEENGEVAAATVVDVVEKAPVITNTEAIGHVLYTDYLLAFQVAGLILLVAMIGAIVLTLRERTGVRRQSVADQVTRKRSDAMEVRKVTPRTGA